MSEKPDQLDERLHALKGEGTALEVHTHEVQIAQAVQLCRIATALEALEATGIYTYSQGTEDAAKEATPRRQG